MTFNLDLLVLSTSFSNPVFGAGTLGSGGSGVKDELPLEELGINSKKIWKKSTPILNPSDGNSDLYPRLSLIGYCMLAMVILLAFSLFYPQGGLFVFVMAGLFVLSTRVCT
ncbi:hypothetical protein MKW94_005766 [Papaver nudicaule]|uniref:PRA1 family protein n=1 Tax=Papaver nudicaule TaxID=74823 RepID=A0AA41VTT2_PAPNU|nr:hypothetical protein [Papaver nudicaule]